MTSRRASRFFRLPRIDGRPGPAERLGAEAAAAIVDAALARHRSRAAPAPRVWRYAAAAGLVCALAGVSTAALFGARAWRAEPVLAPASQGEVGRQTNGGRRLAPRIEAEPLAGIETLIESAPRAELGATPENRRGGHPSRSADLLAEANRLRRRGQWRAAERLYARVGAGGADPWAGYIAKAAAASIRLEHLGDPRGALRLYRQAMTERPDGELGPEVLWGIAACERALGATDREASALRDLVARHRGSPLHPRAERRLMELTRAKVSAP